jgi:hypothetical protein
MWWFFGHRICRLVNRHIAALRDCNMRGGGLEIPGAEEGYNESSLGTKREHVGDGLLSHATNRILPWALAGLTAGFEMGPGGPPPLISPTYSQFC